MPSLKVLDQTRDRKLLTEKASVQCEHGGDCVVLELSINGRVAAGEKAGSLAPGMHCSYRTP